MRPSKVCDVCHTILVRDATPYFSTDTLHTPVWLAMPLFRCPIAPESKASTRIFWSSFQFDRLLFRLVGCFRAVGCYRPVRNPTFTEVIGIPADLVNHYFCFKTKLSWMVVLTCNETVWYCGSLAPAHDAWALVSKLQHPSRTGPNMRCPDCDLQESPRSVYKPVCALGLW